MWRRLSESLIVLNGALCDRSARNVRGYSRQEYMVVPRLILPVEIEGSVGRRPSGYSSRDHLGKKACSTPDVVSWISGWAD